MLIDRSDEILRALEELRRMEAARRQRPISTPEFHQLAEAITAKSRDIFRIARDQEAIGDELPMGNVSLDEPNRSDRAN